MFLAEIIIHGPNTGPEYRKFRKCAEIVIDPERHALNHDLRSIIPLSYAKQEHQS